ncbi:MAG: acyl--CoA ligase [Oscillospiraceae bacterium]|jgi:long-chain acyl-CoA synthetase|nr:acyl--CoA ligase [Oscillospiraceae bacterium]
MTTIPAAADNQKKIIRNPHMQHFPSDIREQLFSDIEENADAYMFRLNADNMDGIALDYFGAQTTYREMDKQVDRLARTLKGYGVVPGEIVAVSLPNLKEIVLYIYALWRIGATVSLIDARTNATGVLERVKQCEARLLVTVMDVFEDKTKPILADLPVQNLVICTPADALAGQKPTEFKGKLVKLIYPGKIKKFLKEVKTLPGGEKIIMHADFVGKYTCEGDVRVPYDPEAIAAIHYTSGTTEDGAIKGVMHLHKAYNAMFRAVRYFETMPGRLALQRGETFGGFIPFIAAYGLFNGLHYSLCIGLTVQLIPVFNPAEIDKLILRKKPNGFLGVPRFFELLATNKKLRRPSKKLAFIRNAVTGGDKISPATMRLVNACFARNGAYNGLVVGYGSTETGASLAGSLPYRADGSTDYDWDAEGNVGVFLPSVDVVVIDPETNEQLPCGVDGEVCVRSLSMCTGYFKKTQRTVEMTYTDPETGERYWRLGDKGHVSTTGSFYFVDRYKRSIFRSDGHTVHPSPIENVCCLHDAVDCCAVVGLKIDPHAAGAVPTAFVMLHEGTENADKVLHELRALNLRELPERDTALAFTVVKQLPYTLMGKVDFRKLEQNKIDLENYYIADPRVVAELRQKK